MVPLGARRVERTGENDKRHPLGPTPVEATEMIVQTKEDWSDRAQSREINLRMI